MTVRNKVPLPTAASFLVSEDCNLACKYCFELDGRNRQHMSKKVARRGLEYLSENALKNGERHFSAMLFGGEPLLQPDIVEEIFSYGVELARRRNLRFSASIVTNATLLTPKIKTILNKYKNAVDLSVQLSIDGVKEVHDRYRVTRDGRGSFDIIEKNIPEWKALFADNIDRLNVHGCCNKDTLPRLYENYIFFREEWDIPRIWFMPIHSEEWDDEDVKVYEEQLNKIADYILERCKKEGNYQEVINYAPIDRCLRPDRFASSPCGAGKNFVTITATGEIYPCHQIYFNDPEKITKVGDIWEGIDELKRNLFVEYDNSDLSCAKLNPDCDAYHCYRCLGENWQQNGSILSVVDYGGPRCEMSKIERKIQLRVKGELEKMGLLDSRKDKPAYYYAKGNNPNNPDCLCDVRGGNMPIPGTVEPALSDEETIAMALKLIIDKLDTLEKGQEFLLKKVLR